MLSTTSTQRLDKKGSAGCSGPQLSGRTSSRASCSATAGMPYHSFQSFVWPSTNHAAAYAIASNQCKEQYQVAAAAMQHCESTVKQPLHSSSVINPMPLLHAKHSCATVGDAVTGGVVLSL